MKNAHTSKQCQEQSELDVSNSPDSNLGEDEDPDLHHYISKSRDNPIALYDLITSNQSDPAFKVGLSALFELYLFDNFL
jgi:hypothetical protein